MKSYLAARTLLLMLALAARASAQARPGFAVAEVRADGLLLPVAKWDGARWHALALARPDSVPYFARGGEWYYVAFSGARARLFAGDAVAILTNDYDSWGFTTNLDVRPFDSSTSTYQRVGVATSDSVPLHVFTAATPRERSLARAGMRRLLDSTRTAGKRAEWGTPPSDSLDFSASIVRTSDGTTLMAAFATLPAGTIAAYPTCPMMAVYHGFVVIRGGRVLVQKSPGIYDCELRELSGDDAHALFELAGRTFVLATRLGWEERVPVIYEWRDSRLSLMFEREP